MLSKNSSLSKRFGSFIMEEIFNVYELWYYCIINIGLLSNKKRYRIELGWGPFFGVGQVSGPFLAQSGPRIKKIYTGPVWVLKIFKFSGLPRVLKHWLSVGPPQVHLRCPWILQKRRGSSTTGSPNTLRLHIGPDWSGPDPALIQNIALPTCR